MYVRPATMQDLPGIMMVEKSQFESISEEAMATEDQMVDRILRCNEPQEIPWFFVAEYKEKIVGYIVVQPISIQPDMCHSWEYATDNGNLKNTFDRDGKNLYIVSLAALPNKERATFPLVLKVLEQWRDFNFKYLMFCSRIPSWKQANEQSGISPEDYWHLLGDDGRPKDWMLRLYHRLGGSPKWPNCATFLPNGYAPDEESGGHGVLFHLSDAVAAYNGTKAIIRNTQVKTLSEQAQLGDAGIAKYWDVGRSKLIDILTLYIPFGCPDWNHCTFCGLEEAVEQFIGTFYKGNKLTLSQFQDLFTATVARYKEVPETVAVFNAGSFLFMPWELQKSVVYALCAKPKFNHLIIEARASLITDEAVSRLVSILNNFSVRLTIRIGVETKNTQVRNKYLRKGHSEQALQEAVAVCKKHHVRVGAYIMLKPTEHFSNESAIVEAIDSIKWILDDLGMHEVYLSATFVVKGTHLYRLWKDGKFTLPTLYDLVEVLNKLSDENRKKVVLLPFNDEPTPIAIPSAEKALGVSHSLSDASEFDKSFHEALDDYRMSMDFEKLQSFLSKN